MSLVLLDIPWGVILILLPLAGGMICFIWPGWRRITGLLTIFITAIATVGLGYHILIHGVYHHALGGWGAPLGIDLHADGLSLLMISATFLVGAGVSIYSTGYFTQHHSIRFWPLWLLLLGALNALFLSADIFNLYVTLEMVGLAAVSLTALPGGRDALSGAMRYLLATLLGSLAYLFGVALLYHHYGSVDLAILATQVEASPSVWAALGLMVAGLLLKTALFPMHFWLPPAHASAPAPVSALLSALVVKGSLYILLRLLLTIFAPIGGGVLELLGLLGAAAILWGSLQALRQIRLKLLVAYSTVAQIGYIFLTLPFTATVGFTAWSATSYLILSHALAKSAMFLAAGNLLHFGGHDRIADLDRVVQRLPLTISAFALAGVSIMGLPPSGGFIGKWLLLEVALGQGRWSYVAVIIIGSLLAAGYVFKVLGNAFTGARESHESGPVLKRMEWAAFFLAVGAILLGFLGPLVFSLISVGDPFSISGVQP